MILSRKFTATFCLSATAWQRFSVGDGPDTMCRSSSVPVPVNGHRAVGEYLIRVVQNNLPSATPLLQGLLQRAVGEDVLDVSSPKFTRPGRIGPIDVLIKKICDPIVPFHQIDRLRPMSPHNRVSGQARNQAAGFDR